MPLTPAPLLLPPPVEEEVPAAEAAATTVPAAVAATEDEDDDDEEEEDLATAALPLPACCHMESNMSPPLGAAELGAEPLPAPATVTATLACESLLDLINSSFGCRKLACCDCWFIGTAVVGIR